MNQLSGGRADALAALRTRRSARRTEGIDPFDVFYQAYITALIAGVATLVASGWIGDRPLEVSRDVIVHDGRLLLGLLTAVAVGTGLRSGSRGGPLAVESADAHHVLLAPIDTGLALRGPALRQMRFLVASATGVGAMGGQLATHRLPGDVIAWMASGAAWAVTTVVLAVGAAWFSAGLRVHTWVATISAGGLVTWAGWSLALDGPASPMSAVGGLGTLALRIDTAALLAVPAAVVLAAAGLRLLGGISRERLRRRSSLVGELRFAATMRDLRTVMMLRRQLNQEHSRVKPWIRLRRRGGWTIVVRRDWRALLRTPATRLLRLVGLSLAAGAAGVGMWRGTTALVVVAGLCSFLAGLEALEPLAQEVDHCTFLDLAPVEKGALFVRHLVVPAAVMLAASMVTVAVVAGSTRDVTTTVTATVVALPAAIAGTMGATISILRDGEPGAAAETTAESMMIPPEAVGMRLLYRTAWPPAVAAIGFVPVLSARRAFDRGLDPVAGALSTAILVLVLCAGVAAWVRYRDDLHTWWARASEAVTER